MKKLIGGLLFTGLLIFGLNQTADATTNWVKALHDTKVESGKVVWASKNLEYFNLKVGKKIIKCHDVKNATPVDGFVFGKGQKMWIEYNKHGIKQVDSYNPIKYVKSID